MYHLPNNRIYHPTTAQSSAEQGLVIFAFGDTRSEESEGGLHTMSIMHVLRRT